ncbi:hypothetical protein QNM97_14025 [Gordonia sp. L191]|uniref:hypothetical protein n=1 Tax=Gordonia sp. L191 TaxID=2982699 RepID=UPI0024BFB432|nr:hypothetical protein [Gordonia sp. L191]WHU45170.1 hypothetical protein QNM97_14025 [Gordonia sp. L191]
MTQASDDAREVPTLSSLISERKRLRGFSYADLENRVDAAISRQRWQQLGTGVRIKEFPEPATISAMAAALDVDVAEVVLAAARSIGLDVKRGAQSDLAARLPSTADRLNEVQRDAIVTLVRSITEVTDDISQEPTPTPSSTEAKGEKNDAGNPRGKADDLIPADQASGIDPDTIPDDYDLAGGWRRGGGESETRRIRREQDESAERGDS